MEEVKGTRVPPPSWIDEKFIESAINSSGKTKLTVESVDIKYANAEGSGYGSLMFRITARTKDGTSGEAKKKSLILKTVLGRGAMKEVFESSQAFRIESRVLHEVMPRIQELLAGAEGAGSRPLAALCYHCGRRPADFLVLEDLAAQGFQMAAAGQPLDYRHCAAALRAYARLHAASAALVSRHPHYREAFSHSMFTDEAAKKHFRLLASKIMRALADELERCPGYERYADKYRGYVERRLDTAYGLYEQNRKQTKLPVLTHGDCWKNNFMFKYLDGEPTEVRLLDFQASNVTSPAADLVYFLYSNASEEVHRRHLDGLLQLYHGALVELLGRLGLQEAARRYPLEELRGDVDRCLDAALIFSIMSGFVLTSEEHGAEFTKAFNDLENADGALAKTFQNPYSLSYMKYLSPIFEEKGIL